MKKSRILIIVLISIVVLGSLAYVYYPKEKPEKSKIKAYKGLPFVYVDSLWNAQIQKKPWLYEIKMHYYPGNLEGIDIEGNISDFFPSNMTFISFLPKEKMGNFALAISELTYNFANGFYMLQKDPLNPITVCSENRFDYCTSMGYGNVVSCDDKDKKVISFRDSDKPYVKLENNNCLAIYGNETTILPATERLLYKLWGVME